MSQRIAKGALLRMDAAELIDFVSRTTLAEISSWSAQDLEDIGWTNNPLVNILYSLTSAGVWIARTDTSGRETEANSAAIKSNVEQSMWNLRASVPPTINGYPLSSANATAMVRKIGILARTITANAGGTLDADIPIVAASGAGTLFFGVAELLNIRANQIVAAGATLVIQNGAGVALAEITLPALTANTPLDLSGLRIFPAALTDNSEIYFDTTSHDLGNATVFTLEYNWWLET